jgi:HPt (histidine-containing phosphotransfer) domain-containing protein
MTDAGPIDLAALAASRQDLGDRVLDRVIDAFLGDIDHRLQASTDLAVVQRNAHTLRGNCQLLGAVGLATLLGRLEAAARDGDRAAVEQLWAGIGPAAGDVKEALTRLRGRG